MPAQCCKDKWPTIRDDEPVFVLRGKDLLAPTVIADWIAAAEENGVSAEKMAKVHEHLDAIEQFQREHPERCKIPD